MTIPSSSNRLRQLPSVHEVASTDVVEAAIGQFGRGVVVDSIRTCLNNWRQRLLCDASREDVPALTTLAAESVELIQRRRLSDMRRVINATGILLHTGLGRAPLPQAAIEAVLQATGYCNVEVDLISGERTKRHEIVAADLCALTGAEAALVVNNNAGATGLVLAAFAAGRELIVSHGELIEIGGGFRLPDVFRAYGAKLRAVGTTNRTRVADYEAAINERTGAIMAIHTSNYQVVGFTEQPQLEELVALARDRDFPVVHDLGSGALVDLSTMCQNQEPLVRDSINKGVGLVLFSGDKLLGGPQAGIIVGRRHLVQQLATHPMSRALRIDKLSLAALQATLAIYRRGESDPAAYDAIPFLQMLQTPNGQLEQRARQLAEKLSQHATAWQVEPVLSEAYAGGGSLPGNKLESWAVAIQSKRSATEVQSLSQQLRTASPPVVGRIHRDRFYLDLRCVPPGDDERLMEAVSSCTRNMESAD